MESKVQSIGSRIDVADVLRGLAVMGIVILHSIEHFNFYNFPDTTTQGAFLNFTDKAIWDSLFFAFGGKAYAVFALLFGFSFYVQDTNQAAMGKDFRLRFLWRLCLLFIIGNFNAMFFTAEILVMYSILGIILVLVCRLPDKWAFGLAVVFLFQPFEIYQIVSAAINPDYTPPANMQSYLWGITAATQANGNFLEMCKVNLWEGQLASLEWAWYNGRIFQTMALFILGMLMGKAGLLLYSEKNMQIWLKILAWSLIAWFPLTGLINMLSGFIENPHIVKSVTLTLKSLANFAFMLMLVVGVLIAFYRLSCKDFLMKMSPYGKMSLTNYLTQSIFGAFFFYNWGLGLFRYLGITASLVFGIFFFAAQFAFCTWWMKNHKQGPFENLWKKVTWFKFR